MLELGQLVTTTDGHSGRLVNAVSAGSGRADELLDGHVPVRSVLLPGGEVRWYVEAAITPLTLTGADADQSGGETVS